MFLAGHIGGNIENAGTRNGLTRDDAHRINLLDMSVVAV
jgi:hypothetical protein